LAYSKVVKAAQKLDRHQQLLQWHHRHTEQKKLFFKIWYVDAHRKIIYDVTRAQSKSISRSSVLNTPIYSYNSRMVDVLKSMCRTQQHTAIPSAEANLCLCPTATNISMSNSQDNSLLALPGLILIFHAPTVQRQLICSNF